VRFCLFRWLNCFGSIPIAATPVTPAAFGVADDRRVVRTEPRTPAEL